MKVRLFAFWNVYTPSFPSWATTQSWAGTQGSLRARFS